jgi:hypothetical protein
VDLFDDDKRLTLKPVAAFDDLLAAAFAYANCTCIRCKEGGGSQEGYAQLHTFDLDGNGVSRQFIKSMASDVLTVLEKPYKASYNADLPAITDHVLRELEAMANGANVSRVKLLLEVCELWGGDGQQARIEVISESAFESEGEEGLEPA